MQVPSPPLWRAPRSFLRDQVRLARPELNGDGCPLGAGVGESWSGAASSGGEVNGPTHPLRQAQHML